MSERRFCAEEFPLRFLLFESEVIFASPQNTAVRLFPQPRSGRHTNILPGYSRERPNISTDYTASLQRLGTVIHRDDGVLRRIMVAIHPS